MDDHRKENRTHLIYYLRVFNRNSQSLFGHVVDISRNGMLITSDKPMANNAQYRLALEDVTTIDHLVTIDIEAECRWCHEDSPSGLYDAGFELIEPSDQMCRILVAYQ